MFTNMFFWSGNARRLMEEAKGGEPAGGGPAGDPPATFTMDEPTLQRLLTGVADKANESAREMLKELGVGKPQRASVASINPPNGGEPARGEEEPTEFQREVKAYGEAFRSRPGWEAQHALLPEAERKILTPENAVAIQTYFRMLSTKSEVGVREVARDMGWEQRALGTGQVSDAAGGYLVPKPLADLIILKRDKRERIAPRSLVVTSEATTLDLPGEDTVGAVQGHPENTPQTDTDSTFQNTKLTKRNASRIVKSSRQLLTDISAAFSLSEILSNQAARKFAAYWDVQSAQGDGVGENFTEGLEVATIATVTGTAGAVTRDIIVSLLYGLPSEWRDGGGAVWMANEQVVSFIGKIVDGTGRPIYGNQRDPAIPTSDVDNVAIRNVEGLPLIETQFTSDILMIGLLSEGFAVLRDASMIVEVTTEGMGTFESHQAAWKFFERRDGAVAEPAAFRKSSGALLAPA